MRRREAVNAMECLRQEGCTPRCPVAIEDCTMFEGPGYSPEEIVSNYLDELEEEVTKLLAREKK
jgi:hypothetical protein